MMAIRPVGGVQQQVGVDQHRYSTSSSRPQNLADVGDVDPLAQLEGRVLVVRCRGRLGETVAHQPVDRLAHPDALGPAQPLNRSRHIRRQSYRRPHVHIIAS